MYKSKNYNFCYSLNFILVILTFLLQGAKDTSDLIHKLVWSLYNSSVHPIYIILFGLTVVNFLKYKKSSKNLNNKYSSSETIRKSEIKVFLKLFMPLFIFLIFQMILSPFSSDFFLSQKTILTYYIVIIWAFSLILIARFESTTFKRLLVKYLYLSGYVVGFFSVLLYILKYRPAIALSSAIVYHKDTLFPGFKVMNGISGGMDTTIIISIFVVVCLFKRKYLTSLIGFIIVIFLMKRTGFLIVSFGFIFWIIFQNNYKSLRIKLLTLMLIFIVSLNFTNELYKFITVDGEQTSFENSSRGHFVTILNDVSNNSPVIGYGFGATKELNMKYVGLADPDNTFIDIYSGTGVLGLSLYLSWILVLILYGMLTQRLTNDMDYKIIYLVMCLLIVTSLTGNFIDNPAAGMPIFMLCITGLIPKVSNNNNDKNL